MSLPSRSPARRRPASRSWVAPRAAARAARRVLRRTPPARRRVRRRRRAPERPGRGGRAPRGTHLCVRAEPPADPCSSRAISRATPSASSRTSAATAATAGRSGATPSPSTGRASPSRPLRPDRGRPGHDAPDPAHLDPRRRRLRHATSHSDLPEHERGAARRVAPLRRSSSATRPRWAASRRPSRPRAGSATGAASCSPAAPPSIAEGSTWSRHASSSTTWRRAMSRRSRAAAGLGRAQRRHRPGRHVDRRLPPRGRRERQPAPHRSHQVDADRHGDHDRRQELQPRLLTPRALERIGSRPPRRRPASPARPVGRRSASLAVPSDAFPAVLRRARRDTPGRLRPRASCWHAWCVSANLGMPRSYRANTRHSYDRRTLKASPCVRKGAPRRGGTMQSRRASRPPSREREATRASPKRPPSCSR